MAEYQAQYEIDVLKIVPSHLAALVEVGGDAVLPKKYLITGGEALKPALVEKLAGAGCAVINHYGPTETTVGSLMLPLSEWKKSAAVTVPIGKPIANTRVYVLDANRELVPVGVAGELYIAGAGVSAGYVGQPEMTAERFVADPFKSGELMYKTGDLVRWLPEGVVEFLGRADDQVKIRGFRVELGEIEAALAAEAGVRQCVVIARARQENPDDKQVVAYVVLDRQQATTTDSLKQGLKDRLPDYMVPSAIVELQKLPLTPNGKVDRKALPAPEERAAKEYKAPATATEELVAQIWEEVLKVEKISTDENFFDLGGHSLLATQVISRIRETFQLEVALRTMFESPVLRDFAVAVDEAKAKGPDSVASAPIKRVARQAYRAGRSNG
jgi:acyl-coenzyme A synthetase/AMP-(fatty) acid ligase/acyl carrier protein